jgi:hypothetical protein
MSIESKFTEIFRNNSWGNAESVSGDGSSLKYTETIRNEIPILLDKFNIKSVFDAPCGDFNWMKEIVSSHNINYIGGDIVKDIADNNQKLYGANNIKFLHFDITKTDFPSAELWICRDCLIHLSYEDILSSLIQFSNSSIDYMLTTTHKNDRSFENKNISSGGFRYIDLFSKPFNFPKEVLYRIDDWNPPFKSAELILIHREQISNILNYFEEDIK